MTLNNYAIALVFGILFGYLVGASGVDVKGPEAAGELAVAHLNTQYDTGQYSIDVANVEERDGYYVVEATVNRLTPEDTQTLVVSNSGEVVDVVTEEPEGADTQGGKVTIVEYADFQCPYCARAQPTIQQILDTYGDQVVLEFKHFPLTSIHPYAQKAAEASECARDQGRFWEYHDILFDNYNALSPDKLVAYAGQAGLDTTTFSRCLESGTKARIVQQDMNEGVRLGVRGTPAFFIEGELVTGAQPFSAFQPIIEEKLAAASE